MDNGTSDREVLLTHLEFILEMIDRLSRNSFLLNGWCVTLVAAVFLLASCGAEAWFAIIAVLSSLTFWG